VIEQGLTRTNTV